MTVNFSDLTEDAVQQKLDYLKEQLLNEYPQMDLTIGSTLYSLLLLPAAKFGALNDAEVDAVRKGSSLLEITNNPALASEDAVDAVISNYGLERTEGTHASGNVVISMTTNNTISIAQGTTFAAGSLEYSTAVTFVGVPEEGMVNNDTDRLIKQDSTGNYYFVIAVVANETGEAYQISQGTLLTMENQPSTVIKTYAEFDFNAASSPESNAELIDKLHIGAAAKCISSKTNIDAYIKTEYPTVIATSSIGFGDADMHRDQDNIFSTSTGGKADVYVQSQDRPRIVRLTKTAYLVDPATSLWQTALTREESSGVYYVKAVLPEEASDNVTTLTISDTTRTISQAGSEVTHTIPSIRDATFTAFQEITVEFTDSTINTTTTPAMTASTYYVDVVRMDDIYSMQNFLDDDDVRNYRYDDIVRAPMACFVSLNIAIKTNQETINQDTIKSEVSKAINYQPFSNRLSAAIIISAVQQQLTGTAYVVMPIDMRGLYLDPVAQGFVSIRSASELVVPTDSTLSISEDTVKFFSDPADIDLELK